MADEILRSKHGFGSLSGVLAALEAGKIDAYDILFLDGDTEPKIGWIDKDNNFRLVKSECVVAVDELPTSGIEGKVYIFTYTSTPDVYETHIEDVNKMLEHLTFGE